jgi:hypothetical protein
MLYISVTIKESMSDLMPKLKKLAKGLHCQVDDDKTDGELRIYPEDGWSFEDGERNASCFVYGDLGSYLKEWRQDAIQDAIDELEEFPPVNIPYKYDDEEE